MLLSADLLSIYLKVTKRGRRERERKLKLAVPIDATVRCIHDYLSPERKKEGN